MAAEPSVSWEEAVAWLRAQPDRQDLVRASYFDLPLAGAAERYAAGEEWRAVRALLPRTPGRALDVGAGNGITSYALARDGWTVTALEPDPSATVGAGAIRSLAQRAGLPIDVVQEVGERVPCGDAAFDVVIARQVLHHARDLEQLCREVARVLKPGGTFLALRDHVISRPADLPRFLAAHPLHFLYGGERAYPRARYRAALEGAGLRIRQELRPFDSVINYAPRSRDELRAELMTRLRRLGPAGMVAPLLQRDTIYAAALRLLSAMDRRPGRLFSFVCERPRHAPA